MATDELQTEEVNELLEILDSNLGEAGDKDSRSIGMQLTLDTHVEIGIQGVRLHRAAQFQGKTKFRGSMCGLYGTSKSSNSV
jgi:hypothetical protein